MHFSSLSAAPTTLTLIVSLLAGVSAAAAAQKIEGTGPKPFQQQQARDYAKSKQLNTTSTCIPTCKTKPAKYGCKVVFGAAAGGAAGLDACCKKACGG
ncbi:MAG: hypothetical protein JNM89_04120 [Hyphomicrobiaceae bacterium]|nr:hypothetical protein [Hyphomicrobiaceae bacterium]